MFKFAQTADVPAHIELAFEQGIPVAVNGIAMPLPELNESLTTIAGDHGIGHMEAAGAAVSEGLADLVLQAREALQAAASQFATGVVRMKLHDGEHTIVSVTSPSLAPHS